MTITQTIEIPADRCITLEIPREIPTGRARVELNVIPFAKKEEKPEAPLKTLEGVITPIADSLLGVAAHLGNITLDEIREEKLAKHLVS